MSKEAEDLLISDVPDLHSRRSDIVAGDHHAVIHRGTAVAAGGDNASSVRAPDIGIQADRHRTSGGDEGGHCVFILGGSNGHVAVHALNNVALIRF